MKRPIIIGLACVALSLVSYQALAYFQPTLGLPKIFNVRQEHKFSEGPVAVATITAGPFDLKRKYRSMEGPYSSIELSIGEMLKSKAVKLSESLVSYTENGGKPAPMNGGTSSQDEGETVKGLVVDKDPPQLYWLKGYKIDTIDEKNHVLPTGEFLCHSNVDIDDKIHTKLFPDAHQMTTGRIFSISQGQTEEYFPDGFGIPVSSTDLLRTTFQAANRTTTDHRRIKQRATFYLIKDSELMHPMQALYWYVPYMTVVVDHNIPDLAEEQKTSCNLCVGNSFGLNAPNNVIGGLFTDNKGRRLTQHWVVAPGVQTFHDVISKERFPGFGDPQEGMPPLLKAAWTHVHPLCRTIKLFEVTKTGRRELFTSTCSTKTNPGLEITSLDYLTFKDGLQFKPEGAQYEIQIVYDNVLPVAVDSMGSLGLFFNDYKFKRPTWALADHAGATCAVGVNGVACSAPAAANSPATASSPTAATSSAAATPAATSPAR